MKRDNRGFLLAESLIVSTFVLTVLIFLFVQFRNLITNYKISYNYNNVESIYDLGSLSNYISTNNIKIDTSSDKPYTIIYKDNTCQLNVNYSTFCDDMLEAMNAKLVIYTSSDISNIKNYVNNNQDDNISQSMRDFINKISAVKVENKGRLLAEFNDGTFSTVAMNDISKQNSSVTGVELCNNNTVTSGDGLYKDTTETGRCVYKGANPNNYITLGSDTYRIISVESDGTLKVIKNGSIGNKVFDPGYSTSISGVTDANSVTGTRYTSSFTDYCYYGSNGNPFSPSVETKYSGCNVWGSRTTMLDSSGNNVTAMPKKVGGTSYNLPESEAYLNTYLNYTWLNTLSTDVQSKIVIHTFNVGVVDRSSLLNETITQESSYKWSGKVGLMNASDCVKSNSNTSLCGTVSDNFSSGVNYSTCKTTSWIFSSLGSSASWTISPTFNPTFDSGAYNVFFVGGGGWHYNPTDSYLGVAPVLYLSSDITLTGEGTNSNPYIIN